MQILIIILVLMIIVGLVGFIYWYLFKTFNEIDEILDFILHKSQDVDFDALKEKRISKLAHKAIKVAKMTTKDISNTINEKETIQSFISDMSHQIKTPLASISMYTDLLLEQNLTDNEKFEFLERLKTNSEKLNWMMDNLINISRLEAGIIELNPINTPIKQTLQSAISAVYVDASKKKITINTNEFQDVHVFHDRKWTIEAIVNILENAIKYSETVSEIQIIVEQLPTFTKICVTDFGIGIHHLEFNDIFKRFYRGQNVQNDDGVGIGLFLTRLILEKQGGYIMVKSVLNESTTFSIFLQNCKN